MCSSTLSVNCEYVEKWAHTVRPYDRVIRLPFSYFSKRSLAPRRGYGAPAGQASSVRFASDHSPKCEHFVKPVDIAE